MSAVNGLSSSASVAYATQLAQSSTLKRSLNNLGGAVQSGDMNSAGSILASIISANPQYASTASAGVQSQSPINRDFQSLTNAISSNQADAARGAWMQIQSDLTQSGVTDLSNGAGATATLLAQTNASISQQILSDAFSTSAEGTPSITSLLGGSNAASGSAGLSGSWLNDWLTYKAIGNTSPLPSAASTSNTLDVVA